MSNGIKTRRIFVQKPKEKLAVNMTVPKQLLRHCISDNELTMLTSLKEKRAYDGMWAAFGTGLGALPIALGALIRAGASLFTKASVVLHIEDYIAIGLFLISIGVGVGLLWATSDQKSQIDRLVRKIRRRPKVPYPNV